MFSPESHLHNQGNIGKLSMPNMPGANVQPPQSNPFSGIRRAGQAKRAQNFEKFSQQDQNKGIDKSFQGAKNQSFGGLANTQVGSMGKMKFS